MSAESNSCYRCSRRSIGCHSICPDYVSWKEKQDGLRENQLKQKRVATDYIDYAVTRYHRLKKRSAPKRYGGSIDE